MQEYIEAHLTEEITLADLARAARYSPWHAWRLFREHTGLSPSDYIRRLRLSKSALRLKNEKTKVSDVAFDLGFGSVDGYQRAFLREFGVCPGQYAKSPLPIPLFIPYGVKFRELRKEHVKMSDVQSVFIQLVRKPARKCIIKRGVKAAEYFAYCGSRLRRVGASSRAWTPLGGEPSACGCLRAISSPARPEYVQGVEVLPDYAGPVPEGFDVIDLPRRVPDVPGRAVPREDYCEAIDALQAAMEKYDPAVIGYKWDDSNPRIQLEPKGTRGYIELRAVNKL